MGALYVGTSGFSYPEWRGNSYPEKTPSAKMLAEYATRLNAVELNDTFFRFRRPGAIAAWLAATHDGFRFCLKVQRSLTYSNPTFPRGAAAADFGSRLAALGNRAGPVLIQFPPAFKRNLAALDTSRTASFQKGACRPRSLGRMRPPIGPWRAPIRTYASH